MNRFYSVHQEQQWWQLISNLRHEKMRNKRDSLFNTPLVDK